MLNSGNGGQSIRLRMKYSDLLVIIRATKKYAVIFVYELDRSKC